MGCLSLRFPYKACIMGSSRVKIMTVDGRCLTYVAPIVVKEILMDHPQHALFDSKTVRKQGSSARPLPGALSLQRGHVYFLIPQLPRQKSVLRGTFKQDSPSARTASASKCSTRSTRKVSFAEAHSDVSICGVETSRQANQSFDVAGSMEGMPLRESSVQILPSPSEGVIRLKMVVSKRQLAGMLNKGGDCVAMVEGLLSPLLRQPALRSDVRQSATSSSFTDLNSSCSWRPSLQSIPESTR